MFSRVFNTFNFYFSFQWAKLANFYEKMQRKKLILFTREVNISKNLLIFVFDIDK